MTELHSRRQPPHLQGERPTGTTELGLRPKTLLAAMHSAYLIHGTCYLEVRWSSLRVLPCFALQYWPKPPGSPMCLVPVPSVLRMLVGLGLEGLVEFPVEW